MPQTQERPARGASIRPSDIPEPAERILGILGGMGPLATAHFYRTLIAKTEAHADQEHLPVVIWADPRIPDRTEAILSGKSSPIPRMLQGLHQLEQAGAWAVAMPCNTAHAYLQQLQAGSSLRIIDMIQATVASVVTAHPQARSIGILGTRGTRQAQLYEAAAATVGLRVVQLPARDQTGIVDEAIRLVKSGADLERAARLVRAATESLRLEGADVAIAACTEIPVVVDQAREVLPVVDSVEALATACLAAFGYKAL